MVNFEDHIEIVCFTDSGKLRKTFEKMVKLLQTFDKIGYATDPYLGNLTTSPEHLGTALKIESTLTFKYSKEPNFDTNWTDELEYGRQQAF